MIDALCNVGGRHGGQSVDGVLSSPVSVIRMLFNTKKRRIEEERRALSKAKS